MTNQEIECTCRVEHEYPSPPWQGWPMPPKPRINFGPCHSPGPEVWEALEELRVAGRAMIVSLSRPSAERDNAVLKLHAALVTASKLLSTRKEKV